jgi:carbamate kinase
VVTQVIVERDDPASREPSKPIGRTMDEATARALAVELGWHIAPVPGGWRRVVPSPMPLEIAEREMIRALVAQNHLVIAAGGGGTPVYRAATLGLEGVDAVVDKDRAAAVLARDVGAEILLILTDVDHVYSGYGTPHQRPVRRLSVAEAEALLQTGELGRGSMAPKVEAAVAFLRTGGKRAVIARLGQGREAVAGTVGTQVSDELRSVNRGS